MEEQHNYSKIAALIDFFNEQDKKNASIEELANHVALSPVELKNLFTQWAETDPKQVLQFTTSNYVVHLLKNKETTLFNTKEQVSNQQLETRLSIEAMTELEVANNGANLSIKYSFSVSQFGLLLLASTTKGLCLLQFVENETDGLAVLKKHFEQAKLTAKITEFHTAAKKMFNSDYKVVKELKLNLKGTEFQLKIWESLLQIPLGELTTYGAIATKINQPKAARAVGTAIGSNPIAYLIPCHRVVQASGQLGGYLWGTTRKKAMIAWEASQINKES